MLYAVLVYFINFYDFFFCLVANKWIHEYGQEFKRPCSLDQYAAN